MGESPRNSQPPAPASAVANPGWIRPPRIYLAAIVIGFFCHLFLRVSILRYFIAAPIGTLLTLVAVLLYVSATRTFKAAGTPVPGNQPATTIVSVGPYQYTRNPIYLSLTLFHLGIAFLINSVAVVLTLLPALGLMAFVVIPREERNLEERFPSEYASYRASVRRWL